MSKHMMIILCFLSLLICGRLSAAEKYLLSNNIKPGKFNSDFPEGTKVLPTDMEHTFVTEGKFASDPESVKTGGSNKLFDGNTGSNWKSRSYSKWGGGEWVTLNLDFKQKYLISQVDVWALHEATRDSDSFDLLFSKDGKVYTPQATVKLDEKLEKKKDFFVRLSAILEKPILAQYMQIRIHRLKSAKQQQIADIAVWGQNPQKGVSYLEAGQRPKVAFTIEKIQSGVVLAKWEDFLPLAAGVKQWKIYSSSTPFTDVKNEGVKLLKTVSSKESQAVLYPFKPGESFFLGITAVYPEGEAPDVLAQKCSMPLPVTCNTFADMVGINHFWGGGGNRQKDVRDMTAYETVALDLLQQCGIRHIRWWVVDKNIYLKYYAKGIGVYTYTHSKNLQAGSDLGVWAYAGAGNEPDLSGKPIGDYINKLRTVYEKKQKICPQAVICAPSSGLEDTSIEWLDRFYQQGGKELFDVLDLHTYCKIAGGHKQPQGYPMGAPEAMYDNMDKIGKVTAKYGDSNKPVISTEFGYSEAIPNNPSGKITPLIKAQYIVRGLVIHHVLGFKRVFLYSFWDEGSDSNFTEHTFGLIDYNLQKKPAYNAVQTLIRVLGKCQLVSEIKGLDRPAFGYHYQNKQSKNNVYVLWDGTGRRRVNFKTTAGRIEMTDLFGKTSSIIPEQDGAFSVVCSASPVYLEVAEPLEYTGAAKLAAVASQEGPVVELLATTRIVPWEASEAKFQIMADNTGGKDSSLRVVALAADNRKIMDKTYPVHAKKKETLEVLIIVEKEAAPLQQLSLQVIHQREDGSFAQEYPVFIRRLPSVTNSEITLSEHFAGLEKPVYTLSNDKLSVSIDANRGARVLEMIERRNSTNQLNIDYSLLSSLPSIPFAYGIWSTVNGKLKNSAMKVEKAENGILELSAKAGEIAVLEKWQLKGNTLTLETILSNPTAQEQKISYKLHPEYTVGGTGDSVTDVFLLPREGGIDKLPFWSGLGEKQCGKLKDGQWAVLDTLKGISLTQNYNVSGWNDPRIWFGQGCYNMEMQTEKGLTIPAGKSWTARISWIINTEIDEKTLQDQLTR